MFKGLRGAVRPVDARLAPTEAERRREAAEQSVCISLGQRLLSEASFIQGIMVSLAALE